MKATAAGANDSVFVLFNHPIGFSAIWKIDANGNLERTGNAFQPFGINFYGSAYIATFDTNNFDNKLSEAVYQPTYRNGTLWRPTSLGNGMNNQTRLIYNLQRYGAATVSVRASTGGSTYQQHTEFSF